MTWVIAFKQIEKSLKDDKLDFIMKILLGRKQAAECLVLPPNQKIVDVATGTGTVLSSLRLLKRKCYFKGGNRI